MVGDIFFEEERERGQQERVILSKTIGVISMAATRAITATRFFALRGASRCLSRRGVLASRQKPSGGTTLKRPFVACAASKEIISTDAAPGAVGPYSQAIKSGGFLYVSGCIPLVPGVSHRSVLSTLLLSPVSFMFLFLLRLSSEQNCV